MQKHLWTIMVKWAGLYWGILDCRAYKTKKEAITAMKNHPFHMRLKRGSMKVVKLTPDKPLKDSQPT